MAQKAPYIDPAVIDWLASLFPDRLPAEPQPAEQTAVLIGEQNVIRKLRFQQRKQQDELLKPQQGNGGIVLGGSEATRSRSPSLHQGSDTGSIPTP
jgi:hypothetical protein